MLARTVEGARVLVSADRYLAGRLAELHLGATVHVLDDGFQHHALARGTDLLIVGEDDLADPRTLPFGRLREPTSAASAAHALLVPAATGEQAEALALRLAVPVAFRLVRETGDARRLDFLGASAPVRSMGPVLAAAGIATPDRFFDEARSRGWDVRRAVPFPDHHRFGAADVAGLVAAARAAGARAILTTEKDLVRLLPFRPIAMPLVWLPLTVRVEPEPAFRQWLAARLRAERDRGGGAPR
jgi:tetraacyldisaccharide 4'-kinase